MVKKIATYTSDSVKGEKLVVAINGQGWVEYAQQFCNVYVTKTFPEQF